MSDDETKVPVAPESRMTGKEGKMGGGGVGGTKTDNERGNGLFKMLRSVIVVPPVKQGARSSYECCRPACWRM
jgi:hypothetical protein